MESILKEITTDFAVGKSNGLSSGKGDLTFNGSLQIDGIFSGKINVAGTLTIGQNSRVTGEVTANDLINNGNLVGTVRILKRVTFNRESVFSGTISASEAEFLEGSKVSGNRNIGRIIEREPINASAKKNILNNDALATSDVSFPLFQY